MHIYIYAVYVPAYLPLQNSTCPHSVFRLCILYDSQAKAVTVLNSLKCMFCVKETHCD